MANRQALIGISRFFRAVYLKIFRINDTPQRVALGLGLGVFTGVLPGAGPFAALALALLFKANRASALLGSILTNTWLSIPVFLLSLRTGAFLTGLNYQSLNKDWSLLIKDFHWITLLDMGVYKILMPILAGYALIALMIGMITYALTLIVVVYGRRKNTVKR